MLDRWKSTNLRDSRYLWLPVRFEGDADGRRVVGPLGPLGLRLAGRDVPRHRAVRPGEDRRRGDDRLLRRLDHRAEPLLGLPRDVPALALPGQEARRPSTSAGAATRPRAATSASRATSLPVQAVARLRQLRHERRRLQGVRRADLPQLPGRAEAPSPTRSGRPGRGRCSSRPLRSTTSCARTRASTTTRSRAWRGASIGLAARAAAAGDRPPAPDAGGAAPARRRRTRPSR